MTSLNKILLAAVLALLGVAGLAVPWYSSRTLDTELKSFADGARAGDLVVHKLAHQAGLFKSSGTIEFQLRDSCEADTQQNPASFSVEYTVSHLPSTRGLMQFDWSLLPQGETLATIEEVIGHGNKLSGTGALGFSGLVTMNMDLPELNFSDNGVTFQITPSKGSLTADKTATQFIWSLNRFVARGKGEALDMKGLSLNMDLKDRTLGTGTISLGVESISTSSVSLEGLLVRSESSEINDRLSSKLNESIKVLKFMGQSINDLALEASGAGLHAPSVRSLLEIGKASCGFSNMTADESQKVRKAVGTLLATGMSIGIPTVKGSGPDGKVSANLMVELLPSKDGTIALEKYLRSSGQLVVTGNFLNPGQINMALSTGYAEKIPDGVKAAYNYQDGLLKISDKTLDAGLVKNVLAQADRAIENFLHPRAAPAITETEEEIEDPDADAPAPR
jgi:hypothetical protein